MLYNTKYRQRIADLRAKRVIFSDSISRCKNNHLADLPNGNDNDFIRRGITLRREQVIHV